MKVNTEEVMLLASDVEAVNNNITDALEKVSAAMKSLNNSWSGAAAEKVISRFNEINNNCIEIQRAAVTDYVNFLKVRVSSGYEQIETSNVSLSDAFK